MKKLGVILLVTLMIIGLAGCASSGKGGGSDAEPYTVDLSTLESVRNEAPFTKNYDDFLVIFPPFPAGIDFTAFSRITVVVDVFNDAGELIAPADGNAMVSLIYDVNGDIRGPEMGPGPNTPLKEMNLGGYSSRIQNPNGRSLSLKQAPGAILFQNSNTGVKYIEIKEITFHNGR